MKVSDFENTNDTEKRITIKQELAIVSFMDRDKELAWLINNHWGNIETLTRKQASELIQALIQKRTNTKIFKSKY
jgi:hypothetical protein